MAILTLYDEQFPCSVAMKGDDYIRLLDEEGNTVFYADGITDFSPYVLDGSWEYPYKGSATIVSCKATLVESVLTLTPRVPCKIEDFATLVFQAPCDCNMVASLSICGNTYDMVDAMGKSIIGSGGAWGKNAYVTLSIDHVNKKAYAQNSTDVGKVSKSGDTIDGDLVVNGTVAVNGMQLATNKVLWSGSYWMIASQNISFPEKVSEQANGLVFVFSPYKDGVAVNADWNCFFVPKWLAVHEDGTGVNFTMQIAPFESIGGKYIYLNDYGAWGYLNNDKAGASNGVTFNNAAWVLRYVIGV